MDGNAIDGIDGIRSALSASGHTQLVLTAAAVLTSRMLGRGMTASIAVMIVAAANASVVAFALMGVRRSGRWIPILLVAVVMFVLSLLVWPAWDAYGRAGGH
jgi:hypothetical protein